MNLFQQFKQFLFGIRSLIVIVAIALLMGACSQPASEAVLPTKFNLSPVKTSKTSAQSTIKEVPTPAGIQALARFFDDHDPQIKILEPLPDQVLNETKVKIRFEVKDLPIFKSKALGLGAHLHVILDNQEYKAAYELNQPLVFENLTAGTHTIRAFASRPWHESFKNEGAYAQTTFHVYTKTGENTPNPQLPLLTYSRPVGTYGAEPVMLDFYLNNTPLHAALLEAEESSDWQIQATVNGQSFKVDQWQPVYLTGLNPGLNWVKLEFLDSQGHVVPNQFNSTAHIVNYQPNGQDTLSRLVRGEQIKDIESIVNPKYVLGSQPTAKPVQATPQPSVMPEIVKESPEPPKIKTPIESDQSKAPAIASPKPSTTPEIIQETPEIKTPSAIAPNSESSPNPEPSPKSVEIPNPIILEIPIAEPTPPTPTVDSPVEITPLPIQITPEPKPLKGLESLNLGEQLKQSREKRAKELQK